MNKSLEIVDTKVQNLLEEGEKIRLALEQFGWKDDRPHKTEQKTVTSGTLVEWDVRTETIPARVRIPPTFISDYYRWYAMCLAVVEANMPSRIDELKQLHDGIKGSGGLKYQLAGNITFNDQLSIAVALLKIQAIVGSVPSYIEGHLYDLELAVAQVFINDQLTEAQVLLKAGYIRAAGAIAGVLLERHLRLLSDKHQPPIKYTKTAGISKLNDALKDAGMYDVPQWRKIQWMGDIRNSCDHANNTEPKKADVADLIAEVKKFVMLFVI